MNRMRQAVNPHTFLVFQLSLRFSYGLMWLRVCIEGLTFISGQRDKRCKIKYRKSTDKFLLSLKICTDIKNFRTDISLGSFTKRTKTKETPKLHGNRCLFSQRGWEKCSRSNKGVYDCYVIDFTILI